MQEVLVNRLGGLSLPRKSVVRLTDRPNMTLDVYSGRKTTMQHAYKNESPHFNIFLVISPLLLFYAYSCPLCNLNTLWNIIMILHSYVEQVMMMFRVQK